MTPEQHLATSLDRIYGAMRRPPLPDVDKPQPPFDEEALTCVIAICITHWFATAESVQTIVSAQGQIALTDAIVADVMAHLKERGLTP